MLHCQNFGATVSPLIPTSGSYSYSHSIHRTASLHKPDFAIVQHLTDTQTATGTAEVGGWSTRELLSILDGLEGLEIVGADVGQYCDLLTSSKSLTVPRCNSRSRTDLRQPG
jgi:hypothetical protein